MHKELVIGNTREWVSSVRCEAELVKKGIRNYEIYCFYVLFLACKHNKVCRELYERIVAKRKSKMLASIAVANKLLKQAFAIGKSGRPYDENFVSKSAQ